jgi:hypothetical protein
MRARLIILVVLVLLLASCGDDDGAWYSSTTGGATTSTGGVTSTGEATSTTGGVTTTAGPGQSGWVRVPHDEAVLGVIDPSWMAAGMGGVTAGGPGLVAVGWRYPDIDYDVRSAAWASVDGGTWMLGTGDEATFGYEGGGELEAVAAGPLGLVAVGRVYNGADYDAVVITSPDGLAWSRVADDGSVFGGPGWQGMHAVVAGGPGWVAVGYDDVGEGYAGDWIAAVWTSSDGATWTRVPHEEALFGGMNDQEMFGVLAAGPGLVAVGTDDDSPAAWVSADGLSWEKVPSDRFFCDPTFDSADKVMRAVAVGPMGLVAVGYLGWYVDPDTEDDVDAAVWVSVDGLDWTLVSEDVATFGGPGNQEMVAVTVAGGVYVAVGWDYGGGDADATVWTSLHGSDWVRVGDDAFGGPGDQQMFGVAAIGSRVVAVGRDDRSAAVWLLPAAG